MPEVTEGGRCRGHCCRCFVLSITYEDLQKSVANVEGATKFTDDIQILDMLIPLGEISAQEAFEKFGVSPVEGLASTEAKPRFTCRHLLSNGDCGIYENSPHMCRSYPKLACQYKECQSARFRRGNDVCSGDLVSVATKLEDVPIQEGIRGRGMQEENQSNCH